MNTEAQSNLRVRLGPVAAALIEGQTDNPRQALDDAIRELTDRAEQAHQDGDSGSALAAHVHKLTDQVLNMKAALREQTEVLAEVLTEQTQMLAGFKHMVLTELQTTRLYIASFLEDDPNPAQEDLLEMGREMIAQVREIPGLLDPEERQDLEKQRDLELEALRRDMERGRDEPETQPAQMRRWPEPEMER
ncbi:hypothetical protein [Ruegeria sp. HKCCD8929]|uniref:hypothetical protein n=1 Tax=Ruegeria sp. HKCCD8929 TaxID=2683006 RepID=UPI001487A0BB|nr:hypothetical protein [Ruegeria sp. HKCCD8929]